MHDAWMFNSAGQIVFGNGALRRLPQLIRRLGAQRVAVLTDPGVAQAGVLRRVEQVLAEAGMHAFVYAEAMPEPDIASVWRCVDRVGATKPELLVGLGGGSSMDLAKIVGLLLTHGGDIASYYGENKVPGRIMPVIAIPTTAGTGSEVSPVAIVTDDAARIKVGLSDNHLRPAVALLDAELTLALPPYVTATTGMDALTQAIEAYYGIDHRWVPAEGDLIYQGSNPMSDLLAERAIELIAQNLRTAVHQGSNLQARANMMLGNIFSALAFSNSGVSWVHAAAYPLAERVLRPHGELVGLLLPYGMRYNATAEPAKFARIAELLGEPANASEQQRIDGGIARVFGLLEDLGLPTKLSQLGLLRKDVECIVDNSLTIERLNRLNPRRLERGALLRVLEEAR